VLESLRDYQRRAPAATQRRIRKAAKHQRVENQVLHDKIRKVAALVDHYYGATLSSNQAIPSFFYSIFFFGLRS
jgi:hypothetical protein